MNQPEKLITRNLTRVAQKSKAEKERLQMNAKNQSLLMQSHIKNAPTASILSVNLGQDVYEPSGEIDYIRFNKASKKADKK